MQILIFANLKERKLLSQIMDWSKKTHIKFQMTFTTDKNEIKRFIYGGKEDFIVVLNQPKVVKILKKMGKKPISVKDDWYKGLKV